MWKRFAPGTQVTVAELWLETTSVVSLEKALALLFRKISISNSHLQSEQRTAHQAASAASRTTSALQKAVRTTQLQSMARRARPA